LYFANPPFGAWSQTCNLPGGKACRIEVAVKNIHMKKTILSLLLILASIIVFAQEMVVQHNSKGAYLVHTVRPKDNFYSVGRMYAVAPKDLAAFNALDMTKGLEIGQTLMIPLTAANYSQAKATGTPVYYVVGEKEGLYRVSMNNGKVLMASLRKWNHLAKDNISTGQKLIVGYLQAPGVTNTTTAAPAETTPQTAVAKEPQPKKEDSSKETSPQPVTRTEEPKKETKTTVPPEVKSTPATTKSTATATGAGYFKSQFDQQRKDHSGGYDETVTSGIFKTTSGWQDAKYYALMDKVEPGTIVQVVNPSNNKSIYAKVLGEMSGIRQNQGLELRISNAAATALDIAEPDKFIVRVVY
jgi:LysM repeat protein